MVLNPDIENPDIENPDIENPDINNPDIENAEVYNPDIENPDIENPDIENPDIETPPIRTSRTRTSKTRTSKTPTSKTCSSPIRTSRTSTISNPDIENPDIENPDIENPDIENPDIENGSIADVTWQVENTGNTTASFNVNVFLAQQTIPGGVKTQLILFKTYRTPATVPNGCQLGFQTRNVLVSSILNPSFILPSSGGVPDQNDPSDKNATMWLGPGEEGRITLRVIDDDPSNNLIITKSDGSTVSIDPAFAPTTGATPAVSSQGVGTEDTTAGRTESAARDADRSQPVLPADAGQRLCRRGARARQRAGAPLPDRNARARRAGDAGARQQSWRGDPDRQRRDLERTRYCDVPGSDRQHARCWLHARGVGNNR